MLENFLPGELPFSHEALVVSPQKELSLGVPLASWDNDQTVPELMHGPSAACLSQFHQGHCVRYPVPHLWNLMSAPPDLE